MAEIVILDRQGQEHRVQGRVGVSVMETLRDLDFGVAAICGGMCSCATCHVHVDPAFAAQLPAMTEDENDLLDSSGSRDANSRLACQVHVTGDLGGKASTKEYAEEVIRLSL